MTATDHLRSVIADNWRACPDGPSMEAAVEAMAAAIEAAGYQRVEPHHKVWSNGERAPLAAPDDASVTMYVAVEP